MLMMLFDSPMTVDTRNFHPKYTTLSGIGVSIVTLGDNRIFAHFPALFAYRTG